MDDRITIARRLQWEHTNTPPVDHIVEIWHGWTIIDAYHDGQVWRDMRGKPIAGSAWWREKVQP